MKTFLTSAALMFAVSTHGQVISNPLFADSALCSGDSARIFYQFWEQSPTIIDSSQFTVAAYDRGIYPRTVLDMVWATGTMVSMSIYFAPIRLIPIDLDSAHRVVASYHQYVWNGTMFVDSVLQMIDRFDYLPIACQIESECYDLEFATSGGDGVWSQNGTVIAVGSAATIIDTGAVSLQAGWLSHVRYDGGAGDTLSPCIITSVPDVHTPKPPSVYPNPASNVINIIAGGYETFEIHDLMGRIVASGTLAEGKNVLDVSTLAAGAYRVLLRSSDGCTSPATFVVAR